VRWLRNNHVYTPRVLNRFSAAVPAVLREYQTQQQSYIRPGSNNNMSKESQSRPCVRAGAGRRLSLLYSFVFEDDDGSVSDTSPYSMHPPHSITSILIIILNAVQRE
jgi:hypothetical protein